MVSIYLFYVAPPEYCLKNNPEKYSTKAFEYIAEKEY